MAVSESPAVRNFKSALWIGVVVMGLFVVYKIVPPYFHNYQFEDAIKTGEKAKSLATSAGQKDLAEKNEQLLQLYRAGKPYHENKAESGK